jgi:HSP20 family protein
MAKGSKEIAVSKGTLERMPRPAFGNLERMFEDFFGRRWTRPALWERAFPELPAFPSVDVIDRDDELVVRAEVPGYKKEEIEVSVADGLLTIMGETRAEEKVEKGNYYRCEISHGAFSRSIGLPAAVDDTKAKASMKDGMLELTLPKREKSKRRSIAIS